MSDELSGPMLKIEIPIEGDVKVRDAFGLIAFPASATSIYNFWRALNGALSKQGYKFQGPPDA